MYRLLVEGAQINFVPDNPSLRLALMFAFVKNVNGRVWIHNKIFEIRLLNYFISLEDTRPRDVNSPRDLNRPRGITNQFKDEVTRNGNFNMELCLKKFSEHYQDIFNEKDQKFLERQGRIIFLMYLKPLINGIGLYEIESQLGDERKIDFKLHYGGTQFIIELKIWYGEVRHDAAYEQLAGYLDSLREDVGYLVTFDFRKNKKPDFKWIEFAGKKILDVVV
jgi:hypothetical protein